MKKTNLLAVLVAVLVLTPLGQAHIPSLEFVIKSAAQKRSGFGVIRMTHQLTLPNQKKIREQILIDPPNQTVRLRYLIDGNQVLYGVDRKWNGVGLGAVLWSASSAEWLRALRQHGVVSSADAPIQRRLARTPDAKVCWSFGSSSEIWFEKDAFLPVHYQSSAFQLDWQVWSWSHEFAFPRQSQLKIGDQIWRAEVLELVVNADATEQKKFLAWPIDPGAQSHDRDEVALIQRWIEIAR